MLIIRKVRATQLVRALKLDCVSRAQLEDGGRWFQSKDAADVYAKFRPTYDKNVYDAIFSFYQEPGNRDFSLAVDLACGSGQGTVPLTKRFKQVIGVDVSQAQLDRAPKGIPNLSFRLGPAEDLSFLEDDSVDLVTVAQAIHYMDVRKLYPELKRVLKPGGTFVTFGYYVQTLDEPEAQEVLNDYYYGVLKPYWSTSPEEFRRETEERTDKTYELPFPGWRSQYGLKLERSWPVDVFVKYLRSLMISQKYLLENPEDNALPSIEQRFKEIYRGKGGKAAERKMKVTWPIYMLMGHKPVPTVELPPGSA